MNVQPRQVALNFPDAVLVPGDEHYPAELLDLGDDAPQRLHARGNLLALQTQPRIAIVGTRRATAYGLRITQELTTAFVRAGACVVSGMASGIDGAAHRATLAAGGTTIAILGTGFNQVYPRGHRPLQQSISETGLLLSELEAAEHGMKFTFVHRNRIIAALARLIIIVEAPEKSGALVTADRAADLGREVAVVPGNIDQPQNAGANRLIRDGATCIASVEDALALVGLTAPPRAYRGAPEGEEGRVWAALAGGALDIDSLCAQSGLPAARCLSAVTKLELAGSIECAMTGEIRRR
jgi:DNA processing protein